MTRKCKRRGEKVAAVAAKADERRKREEEASKREIPLTRQHACGPAKNGVSHGNPRPGFPLGHAAELPQEGGLDSRSFSAVARQDLSKIMVLKRFQGAEMEKRPGKTEVLVCVDLERRRDNTRKQAHTEIPIWKLNWWMLAGTSINPFDSLNGCKTFLLRHTKLHPQSLHAQAVHHCKYYNSQPLRFCPGKYSVENSHKPAGENLPARHVMLNESGLSLLLWHLRPPKKAALVPLAMTTALA
ncbi:hypothetical protein C8F04DRAFT_1181469 [Mycena alexandri]|uniref:Uncharacterized protein n=1 Tax=Mycena alexandri TaxID=1745969 RepID=A0AAD6SZD2_9AGAR|nr:hypothetical protein C8F04DRAFT_1181469 [Mycena alexandri]